MMIIAGRHDAVEGQTIRRATVLTLASEDSSHCFLGLAGPNCLSSWCRHPIEGIYKHIMRTTTGKTRAPRQCAPGNLTPYRTTTVQKHNKKAKRTKGTHCPAPEPAIIPVGSGTYNFKPTPHATTIDVTASSNTGAVRVTFPDGWLYVWTAATPQQLELLFAGPIGKYTAGQIAQNVVLTDQTSLRNCLFRFTSKRLFQILGSPAMSSKGAAPVGIYIFWGATMDWSGTTWTQEADAPWTATFTPNGPGPSASASFVTGSLTANASIVQQTGSLVYTGVAAAATAKVTIASSQPVSGFFILGLYIHGPAGDLVDYYYPPKPNGTVTLGFHCPGAGNYSIQLIGENYSGAKPEVLAMSLVLS